VEETPVTDVVDVTSTADESAVDAVDEQLLRQLSDRPRAEGLQQFDTHIRTVTSTTNAIESVNARIRRAVNARGHFPNEQAAMKCVYLAVMSLDQPGPDREGPATLVKPVEGSPPARTSNPKSVTPFNLTDPRSMLENARGHGLAPLGLGRRCCR
jgi:mutator family transposase